MHLVLTNSSSSWHAEKLTFLFAKKKQEKYFIRSVGEGTGFRHVVEFQLLDASSQKKWNLDIR